MACDCPFCERDYKKWQEQKPAEDIINDYFNGFDKVNTGSQESISPIAHITQIRDRLNNMRDLVALCISALTSDPQKETARNSGHALATFVLPEIIKIEEELKHGQHGI